MKKILVYCQHVLGIGHLARMAGILKQLRPAEVTLVLGGPEAALTFPDHVRILRLPGLEMDAAFSALRPVDPGVDLEEVKSQRRARLHEIMDRVRPDIFLVELFPFGRCGFRFELDPLLAHVRREHDGCSVVCSVRDILVERDNREKFERRVVERLNRWFDLLLIHADPEVITLDATFSRMGDLQIPVRYTGYVAEKAGPGEGKRLRESLSLGRDEPLIVASAGSGSVGLRLLEAVLQAHALWAGKESLRLQLFSGPYLAEKDFRRLARTAAPGAVVERFSDRFPAWLAAADLSISMGGYNTTINVAGAGCPALIFPFARNREQRLRAEKLAAILPLRILEEQDLEAGRLADLIGEMLKKQRAAQLPLLDGAKCSARLLLEHEWRREQ